MRASGVRARRLASVSTAARAVIANVDPRLVFGKLVAKDERRAGFDAQGRPLPLRPRHDDDPSGAADLPDWKAGEELQRFAYVHLAPIFE